MSENIYKRGNIYWGRFQVRGKDIRRSLRTASLVEAKKRRKKMLDDIEHMKFHGDERKSWKAAAVSWAADAPSSIRPGTLERYLTSLKQVRSHLDSLYLDEIDNKIINKIAKRKGASNATRRRDLTAVSSVLRHAVSEGWIDTNPARTWDRSVIRERREPINPPTDEDIYKLAAACPATFGDSILFLRATGMRQMEGVSLEWPQIDLKHREVTLTRTKTNRPRVVPLSDEAMAILARQPRHITRHTVFHHDGKPFKNYASRFAGYAKRNGFLSRCHDLRHKFAIAFLRETGDIYRLSRVLGHSSVKTTEIYLGYVDLGSAQKPAQRHRFEENKDENEDAK